jgi:hypothetical protein
MAVVRFTSQDRNGQRHEWGHDAVIEPALHIEAAPDAAGHQRIGDDAGTEPSVGRCKTRRGQDGEPHSQPTENETGGEHAEGHRQWEADPKQPGGHAHVVAERCQPEARRIGEEDEHQCDLRCGPYRRCG